VVTAKLTAKGAPIDLSSSAWWGRQAEEVVVDTAFPCDDARDDVYIQDTPPMSGGV
jgi:hypothetical protein